TSDSPSRQPRLCCLSGRRGNSITTAPAFRRARKIVNPCRSNGSRGGRSCGKLPCQQDLHNLGRPSGRYTKYHQEDPSDVVTGSSIGPAEPGHSGLLIKKGRSGSDSGPSLSGEREPWAVQTNLARVRFAERRSSLLGLGKRHEPSGILAGLHVERDRIRFRGQVLEFLDSRKRLDLAVANDLGDHVALLDSFGVGAGSLLDLADQEALDARGQIERLGQFGGQRLDI